LVDFGTCSNILEKTGLKRYKKNNLKKSLKKLFKNKLINNNIIKWNLLV